MLPRPPRSSLFPYTTLFRSDVSHGHGHRARRTGRDHPDPERQRAVRRRRPQSAAAESRSEEHTSELQSPCNLVCRLLLEKKKRTTDQHPSPNCSTQPDPASARVSRSMRAWPCLRSPLPPSFLFPCSRDRRDPHSFPTRRSSDLTYRTDMDIELEGQAEITPIPSGNAQFDAVVRSQLPPNQDRKSTRLNSSHLVISYAVFCLKKKNGLRTSTRRRTVRRSPTLRRREYRARCVLGPVFAHLCPRRFCSHAPATAAILTLSLHDALPI